MQGEQFDVDRVEESLELVFNDCVGPHSILRLGPGLSRMLLERQRDHVQSIQAFVSALKVGLSPHIVMVCRQLMDQVRLHVSLLR